VVEGPRVVGIVTRTDLVSALAQRLALVQVS
jgi:CBS domain-containing protein